MRRPSGQEGFTLIEVLVASALAVIVFAASLTMIESFQRQSAASIKRNETEDLARSAVDRLAHELRSTAAPSVTASGALEVAEPYSVTFQTIDPLAILGGSNATNNERMRYCLNNSTPSNGVLWLQTKTWTSAAAPSVPTSTECPDLNAQNWTTSTRLVEHVTNRAGGQDRPLFTYGPAGASSVTQIVSVTPNLYIDLTPGGLPTEAQLSTTVDLRNENRKPTASFTAVELSSTRRVLLNASESTDPDGLALTYNWWQNGTLMTSTAQQFETEPLTLGATYTFKLEVADPGGLTGTTEQTVTIK